MALVIQNPASYASDACSIAVIWASAFGAGLSLNGAALRLGPSGFDP